MGCCFGRFQVEDRDPLIVDVQKVIADEVWNMFRVSSGRFRQYFIKRKDYFVEVPMNFYHFEETFQELTVKGRFYNTRQQNGAKQEGPPKSMMFMGSDCPVKVDYKEADDDDRVKSLPQDVKAIRRQDALNPEHYGLETEFKNDTEEAQTYNFSFQKERRAAVEVNYQRGFSIGGKATFKLGLPKVLADGSLDTEISAQYEVSKSTGQVFEETITTSATSQITVSPYSHYTASVIMEERCLHADFKVKVKMSMPSKVAQAYIKDKQGETVFYYRLRNLADLFPLNAIKDRDGRKLEDAVEFTVEGVVNGMQLANHKIELRGDKLPKRP